MPSISDATRGKKVLCNPPVRAALPIGEMSSLIDSAEELLALDLLNEAEVHHLIAADETYLEERGKCDGAWSKRYKAVLESAVERIENQDGEREEY